MSEYIEMKKVFYKDVVTHGMKDLSDLKKVYPLGCRVPDERISKWLKTLLKPPAVDGFPVEWKHVNRFTVGADPEFVFVNNAAQRVDASTLEFRQGRAFGADNNGRLAEIRPQPDRSTLVVTASIMSTLRWMALVMPATRSLEWRAGAFQFNDGLGGHVHFGRKGPLVNEGNHARPEGRTIHEVAALDTLNALLLASGIYPADEVRRRTNGDAHGQIYGRNGDIRAQNYGYEYRTFPSWLDNPWSAFFTMTLAKLAVHNPELLQRMAVDDRAKNKVANLLAYYKGVDDDAALAYRTYLRIGLPQHYGGDFKTRWGAEYPVTAKTAVQVVPGVIKASDDEIKDMFHHLGTGTELATRIPEPAWGPTTPPRGFFQVLDMVNTVHVRGLGELLSEAAMPEELKRVRFTADDRIPGIQVSPLLLRYMPSDWKQRIWKAAGSHVPLRVAHGEDYRTPEIRICRVFREPSGMKTGRKILYSGAFPIFPIKTVAQDSYSRYQQRMSKKEMKGKVLYSTKEG